MLYAASREGRQPGGAAAWWRPRTRRRVHVLGLHATPAVSARTRPDTGGVGHLNGRAKIAGLDRRLLAGDGGGQRAAKPIHLGIVLESRHDRTKSY
jgi:hypothetical protein